MRKVIKIFLSVFSAILLAAIILPIAVALLLYLPSVQTFAVRQAAVVISNRMNAEVSVEKVHIRFFNRFVFDGIYMEDTGGDTLLYARHLTVSATRPELFSDNMGLGKVKLTDVDLHMCEDEDGTSNLAKVFAGAKSRREREKKPFRLRAASVEVENMSYTYTKHEITPREYGLNFSDLEVSGLTLSLSDVTINGDSIAMRIDNVSLREKSGFTIESLSSDRVTLARGGMRFGDLRLTAAGSQLSMDYLNLLYDDWQMNDFLRTVQVEAQMKDSRIDTRTLAYFGPGLRGMDVTLYDVKGYFEGPVADIKGRFDNARLLGSRFSLDYAVRGLPDMKKADFTLNVQELVTNAADVEMVMASVGGKEMPERTLAKIEGLGAISLHGYFSGRADDFTSDAQIGTDRGDVSFDLTIHSRAGESTLIAGSLLADRIDAGYLADSGELGEVSFEASLEGMLGSNGFEFNTNARISNAAIMGYDYRNVEMNGHVDNRFFSGSIISSDPNINFAFDGLLDFNDSVPNYDFAMDLTNADLRALNINPRDSVSKLSCRIEASGSGSSLDELNGNIVISDVFYRNHIDTVLVEGGITITGVNGPQNKYISVRSSLADAEFRSRTSYKELFPEMAAMLEAYMPTLSTRERNIAASKRPGAPADAANYSLVKLNVKQANNLAGAILPGLIIAEDTELSLLFNPLIRKFNLTASSQYIEYNNSFASDIEINSRDEEDSLALYLRAGDLYLAGLYMPDFSVVAGARDNKINAATRFSNTQNGMSALVGLAATLGRDTLSGKPRALVTFTPSTFTIDNRMWNIFTRGITVGDGKVSVDNFNIVGSGQSLNVDGVASASTADTLRLSLTNFDMAPATHLTQSWGLGYNVSGNMSGSAEMVSALKNGIVRAQIRMDSVCVNDVEVPPSDFVSLWDMEHERARFWLTEVGKPEPSISGAYRPSENSYLAQLNMKGIDLSLLEQFLNPDLKDISGLADAQVEFSGQGRMLKTNGVVKIREMTALIDYLNVPYTVRDAELGITDNVLLLPDAQMRDPEGNGGPCRMWIDLNNLKNVAYDIEVRPANTLVLNTTEYDNDMFYGRVYASGSLSLTGDKRGTNMIINATTANRSEFHMPLSGKADVAQTDFIVFKKPDVEYVDSSDYQLRKMRIFGHRNRARGQADASNLNINMVVNVLPNALVEIVIDPKMGGKLQGRGTGSISLNIDPSSDGLAMYGDYQISEGVYALSLQDVIDRNFMLEQGSNMQWRGDPVDALLDMSAVYTLRTSLVPLLGATFASGENVSAGKVVPVECRLRMTERLSNPLITFNITVPNADTQTQNMVANALNTQEMMATQFFSLLATRSFVQDANIGSASGGTDQLVNMLSSQLSSWLSNDRFNIGMSYRSQSEWNSDEFNIDFSTYLAGNRLLLEVEGNYDANNAPTLITNRNTSNISGDFALTWLIDRSGNLRLKGFRRTIDRFDENQGLPETGIGIYYREDFDTFADILRNIRERFSIFGGKKRRETAAEQSEQDSEVSVVATQEAETEE